MISEEELSRHQQVLDLVVDLERGYKKRKRYLVWTSVLLTLVITWFWFFCLYFAMTQFTGVTKWFLVSIHTLFLMIFLLPTELGKRKLLYLDTTKVLEYLKIYGLEELDLILEVMFKGYAFYIISKNFKSAFGEKAEGISPDLVEFGKHFQGKEPARFYVGKDDVSFSVGNLEAILKPNLFNKLDLLYRDSIAFGVLETTETDDKGDL